MNHEPQIVRRHCDEIDYAEVVALIANADATEAEDLACKQAHHPAAPESRENPAKDVAAFADTCNCLVETFRASVVRRGRRR
ncbi:hypothetical protein [Embleya sp. NPDC005575]|uniref:hypothetical protein n=1 Tax=Embleya sp. NPDC005575 TaxID=3156892 RepID=UPI0033BA4371